MRGFGMLRRSIMLAGGRRGVETIFVRFLSRNTYFYLIACRVSTTLTRGFINRCCLIIGGSGRQGKSFGLQGRNVDATGVTCGAETGGGFWGGACVDIACTHTACVLRGSALDGWRFGMGGVSGGRECSCVRRFGRGTAGAQAEQQGGQGEISGFINSENP